jgi:hypothetical protein
VLTGIFVNFARCDPLSLVTGAVRGPAAVVGFTAWHRLDCDGRFDRSLGRMGYRAPTHVIWRGLPDVPPYRQNWRFFCGSCRSACHQVTEEITTGLFDGRSRLHAAETHIGSAGLFCLLAIHVSIKKAISRFCRRAGYRDYRCLCVAGLRATTSIPRFPPSPYVGRVLSAQRKNCPAAWFLPAILSSRGSG